MHTRRMMLRACVSIVGLSAVLACSDSASAPNMQAAPGLSNPNGNAPVATGGELPAPGPVTTGGAPIGVDGPAAAMPTVPAVEPTEAAPVLPGPTPATDEAEPPVDVVAGPDDGAQPPGQDGASGAVPSDCLCRGDDPTEAALLERAGPYAVESYTSGFPRPSGVDSATVFYPTDAEPPFAGVAIVPGFVSPESSIRQWGPFLASHGIVTVTIGVPGGDQPRARKTKLLATIEALKGEQTRSGAALNGQLDLTRLGVAGWSMGGGGASMAIVDNPELKAAVTFAAWGPSGGEKNTVPILMFEATSDTLAARMSDGYYRAVPDSVPKMLFEVQGSSHSVANSPHNHDGVIGKYGLSWFKVFLEGDGRYRQFLTQPFPSITTDKSAHNL